jgi:hypothetical protein
VLSFHLNYCWHNELNRVEIHPGSGWSLDDVRDQCAVTKAMIAAAQAHRATIIRSMKMQLGLLSLDRMGARGA